MSNKPTKRARPSKRAAPRRPTYTAEDARPGEVILRQPWQRVVFVAGIVGAVILALIATYGLTR